MSGMVDHDRIEVDANSWKLAAARERGYLQQAKRIRLAVDLDEDAERHRREHPHADSFTHRQCRLDR
ncbi:hypothetical protein ACGFIY_20555 [Micromonospora chersina]|uniref:hypothetical protein n=1 Tax=Micromonospora chersina TaxID=47854 RepID=UPI0037210CCF